MRAANGYLGVLGTTGLLTVSVVVLLVVGAGVAAFEGPPDGGGTSSPLERIVVEEDADRKAPGRAEDSARSRSRSDGARGVPERLRSAAGGGPGGGVQDGGPGGGAPDGGSGDGAPGGPSGGGPGGGPADGGAAGEGPPVGDTVGGVVDGATGVVGGTLDRVAPGVGAPMTQVGSGVDAAIGHGGGRRGGLLR